MAKTATTYLQHDIFPKLNDPVSICKPGTRLARGHAYQGAFGAFFNHSPTIWSELGDRLLGEIGINDDDDRAVLISDEGMTGGIGFNPIHPFTWREPYWIGAHLAALRHCARRHRFFQVKVLLVFRRQDASIASRYAQTSDRRTGASQPDFERCARAFLDARAGRYKGGALLQYDVLLQRIRLAVGAENILMLPYEMLRTNPRGFAAATRDFLASDDLRLDPPSTAETGNVRTLGQNQWRLRPRHHSLGYRIKLLPPQIAWRVGGQRYLWLRPPDIGRGKTIALTPQLSAAILRRYEDSNRALAKCLELDLSQYGYMPQAPPTDPKTFCR